MTISVLNLKVFERPLVHSKKFSIRYFFVNELPKIGNRWSEVKSTATGVLLHPYIGLAKCKNTIWSTAQRGTRAGGGRVDGGG